MALTEKDIKIIMELIEQRVAEIKVTREEFSALRDAIFKLIEVQSKFEERLTKLEEAVNKLAEAQIKFEERLAKLEEAQIRFEERLARLEEAQIRLEERLTRLEEAVNKLAEAQIKFEERLAKLEERVESLERIERNIMIKIGALGARWGIDSEIAFRNALKGILAETGYQVETFLGYDAEGFVFYGRPDQIEIDLIIKDAKIIAVEIKSSVSKTDIAIFNRKVDFYEKVTGKKVTERIAISPFVDPRGTEEMARKLNIKIYSSPEELGSEASVEL